MSDNPAVVETREGHVAVLTINRPEARNACNQAVWIGMGEALERANADPHIRVVIVTGAGDQSFCAGADLKAIARGEAIVPQEPRQAGWGFAGLVSHVIDKPVIAAVNGTALGGGTEIVLACDLAVSADHATFGLPEVKRGIIAGAGGAFRMIEQLPRKIGLEMLLTGDAFSAARALELGLVNRVVPAADLRAAALELAHRIADNAPLSVQASKRIALGIAQGEVTRETARWALNQREMQPVIASHDAKEGVRAFVEKRAPRWTGC